MKRILKKIIKQILPPILFNLFRRRKIEQTKYGWFGNYQNWIEANKDCTGYDSQIIAEKVKMALLKVKNGDAIYERDSVLFDSIQYSWPLLSMLLRISFEQGGRLHLVDFGGSLGTTYYQNRDFLSIVSDLKWNIVEQQHYVNIGKVYFEDKQLKFYYSIDECLANDYCSLLLLSSVIQYLEFPFSFLENIKKNNFEYIIFDRTAFIDSSEHIITIQLVPPEIYDASYPCWYFNEVQLLDILLIEYDLIYSFPSIDKSNIDKSYFKGFVLKKKKC